MAETGPSSSESKTNPTSLESKTTSTSLDKEAVRRKRQDLFSPKSSQKLSKTPDKDNSQLK